MCLIFVFTRTDFWQTMLISEQVDEFWGLCDRLKPIIDQVSITCVCLILSKPTYLLIYFAKIKNQCSKSKRTAMKHSGSEHA